MNTKDIIVLVWDDPSNFNSEETQRSFGNGNVFKRILQFKSLSEFEEKFKAIGISEKLVFACHIKVKDLGLFEEFIHSGILEKYNIPSVHYLSSDPENAPEKFKKKFGEIEKVIYYNTFIKKIRLDEIKPFKRSTLNQIVSQTNGQVQSISNPSNHKSEYIFISHSSKDKDIVTSFFDNLLRLGLDISQKNIFYSSHPASGISLGEDIPDELKKALNKMTIFIQYVSKSYKKSEVCLNEMGAAWVRLPKSKILILKAPDVKFKDLSFLNIQRLALNISKKEDLLMISESYKNIFDFNSTDYALKVDKFLKDNGF